MALLIGSATTSEKSLTMQVTTHDTTHDKIPALLDFCSSPKTREEMQAYIGIANREHFRKAILKPLLESGQIKMTIPDKPKSKNQKYIRA